MRWRVLSLQVGLVVIFGVLAGTLFWGASFSGSQVTDQLAAQKITQTGTGGGGSPHEKVEWTVDGAAITIEYGRPYLKGRPEAQMMPPAKPWRTGADQATVITSSKPLTFGTAKLEANTPYTINTVPGGWSAEGCWAMAWCRCGSNGWPSASIRLQLWRASVASSCCATSLKPSTTVSGSGTTYNVAVSGMTKDGTVIASVDAGKATDEAGNGNAA